MDLDELNELLLGDADSVLEPLRAPPDVVYVRCKEHEQVACIWPRLEGWFE